MNIVVQSFTLPIPFLNDFCLFKDWDLCIHAVPWFVRSGMQSSSHEVDARSNRHDLLAAYYYISVTYMKPVEGIRDPWDRVQTLAEQCLRLSRASTPFVPPKVPAFLGWLLARLSNSYYGQEAVFFSKAIGRFVQAAEATYGREVSRDEIYHLSCYPGKENIEGRRSPGFAESTIETARRLRDLRLIEEAVSKTTAGAVVGGAMSYGKFINVKGGADASDIDLLVVVDSWNDLATTLAHLRGLEIVSAVDVDRMTNRAENMLSRWGDRDDIAFSAKAAIRADQEDPFLVGFNQQSAYKLSLHFMSREGADIVLMKDYLDLSISDELKSIVFMDYREEPPTRDDFQRSFSGDSLNVPVKYTEHLGSYERFTASLSLIVDDFTPECFRILYCLPLMCDGETRAFDALLSPFVGNSSNDCDTKKMRFRTNCFV